MAKFVKPTIEEIAAYCLERKNGIDAEEFWHYYESKGWKIGQTPMKSWHSAVVTWEKRKKQGIFTKTTVTHKVVPSAEETKKIIAPKDAPVVTPEMTAELQKSRGKWASQ